MDKKYGQLQVMKIGRFHLVYTLFLPYVLVVVEEDLLHIMYILDQVEEEELLHIEIILL